MMFTCFWWKMNVSSDCVLFLTECMPISRWMVTDGWFCCSVAQLCLTICHPRKCNMPGFPVLHYLWEFAQTYVQWFDDTIQPSHPLSSPSLALNLFQHSGCFPVSQFFTLGQSIGVSTSASVVLVNIQDWFPLGWTSWISLHSKGLSKSCL